MTPAGEHQASAEAAQLIARASQVGVQPPPSARARVWQRVETKARRPRWRFAWPAFAAGAVCATLVVMLLVPRDRPDGEALVLAADGTQRIVKPGEKLPQLLDLSLVDLHGAGRAVAGPGTLATLVKMGPNGVELKLDRGSLLMHVTPRPARAPLWVRTAKFSARVVGTVLRVAVHADGSASLAVGHGAVEVTPVGGGRPVMVRSGERWPRDAADAPSASELEKLGATDLEGVSASAFVPSSLNIPAPSSAVPSPAAPADPCAAATTPDARLRCTLALADDGDPLRAESALFQAGWIAWRELHDRQRALAIWERQRDRFPSGILRHEAHASIIDALIALHRSARARAEIDDYLRRDPRGLRSAELHYVRGTLLREADGSCKRASREFELALRRPAEPWAREARRARAACAASR